jgi:hypothetical protein
LAREKRNEVRQRQPMINARLRELGKKQASLFLLTCALSNVCSFIVHVENTVFPFFLIPEREIFPSLLTVSSNSAGTYTSFYSIIFYSFLLYSILFYSILFYSILFYSILFYSILFYSILFYSKRFMRKQEPKTHEFVKPCIVRHGEAFNVQYE